ARLPVLAAQQRREHDEAGVPVGLADVPVVGRAKREAAVQEQDGGGLAILVRRTIYPRFEPQLARHIFNLADARWRLDSRPRLRRGAFPRELGPELAPYLRVVLVLDSHHRRERVLLGSGFARSPLRIRALRRLGPAANPGHTA